MKKLVTFLLLLAMTLPVTSCNNKQENTSQPENSVQQESSITTESNTAEIEQPQTVSPTKLTNKMTELELDLVNKHALTLLDEIEKPNADPNAEHKVSIEFQTIDLDEWRKSLEEQRNELTDDEYNSIMSQIQKAEKAGGEYRIPMYTLVDGYLLMLRVPYEDPFYDGGTVTFNMTGYNENGEPEVKNYSFDTFEEYLEFIRNKGTELFGYTAEQTELTILHMQLAN
ncbi:MAG: hypothetical protein IKK66_05055, partial [Ruminococcus sp.]|nr:hypothetical protein [Ruminococcus sp.]